MIATLRNNHSEPLAITGITISGSAAADFSIKSDCPFSPKTLAYGESCKLEVTFIPSSSGLRTATLKIGSVDSATIALAGTGVIPADSSLNLEDSSGAAVLEKPPGSAATLQYNVQGSSGESLYQESARGRPLPVAGGVSNSLVPLKVITPQSPVLGNGLSAVVVTPSNPTIVAGTTEQFTATGYYADGTKQDLTGSVVWTSSAPGVATIGSSGLAISIAGGSATITATFVTAAPLSSVGGGTSGSPIVSAPSAPLSSSTALGVTGIVGFSASSIVFASQNVGTISSAQGVTLTNRTGSSLVFSSIQLAGADSGDFALSASTCNAPLPVLSSCSVNVTFNPAAPLGRSASLIFTDNSNNVAGTQQTVLLSGSGIAPLAGVAPAGGIGFSNQNVFTNDGPAPVTLSNLGNAPLAISNFAITGSNAADFAIPSTTCGSSLAASTSCTIYVKFTPSAPYLRAAALVVTDNSGNIANSQQTVGLSGTGLGPLVTMTPAPPAVLNFNTQVVGVTSAAMQVSLFNSGNATLSVNSEAITGANAGDFQIMFDTCADAVPASSGCTTSLAFTPQAGGTRTATLTYGDNANPSQQSITLTGTGVVENGVASILTTSLTFTALQLNDSTLTQPVTISNAGKGPLSIAGIVVTSGASVFSSQYTDCGQTLYSGTSCTVNMTFTPTAGGTSTGTLTITDNSGGIAGSQQTVSLTGLTNAVQVNVTLGPSGNVPNGIYTTVTVCEPGGANCVAVPNVLVDTGSAGLRVLASQLDGLNLPSITNASGNSLYECAQAGSLSYTWGQVQLATIQLTGETASQVPGGTANSGIPIQVIPDGQQAPATAPCASGGEAAKNTQTTLNANGILGIGIAPQDCTVEGANECATEEGISVLSPYPYVFCGATCELTPVPLQYQVWNPVAAFSSSDTNGVLLDLPGVALSGAPSLSGSTLTFGIDTQSNNAIPDTATIFEVDGVGRFPTISFNGVNYADAGYLNSSSNSYQVSDAATLTAATGITTVVCADSTFYCPATQLIPPDLTLILTLNGSNGTLGKYPLYINNADALFSDCPGCVAFDSLAAPGGTSPSNDQWVLGLPFFFGKQVFVGIAGGTTYPNGYWAF